MNFGKTQVTQIAAQAAGTSSSSSATFTVVRELTLDEICSPVGPSAPTSASSPTLISLKSSHHNVARLLAEGRPQVEVALMTGYNPTYISRLVTSDLAFQGLMRYYTDVAEVKLVDSLARMKSVGIDALEELQARLANDPSQFSIQQLAEIAELMLLRPAIAGIKAGSVGPGGGGSASISISFKAPEGTQAAGVTIEGEVLG